MSFPGHPGGMGGVPHPGGQPKMGPGGAGPQGMQQPPHPGQFPPGHPGQFPNPQMHNNMPFAQFPQFPQHPQQPPNQQPPPLHMQQQQFQQFPQFPTHPQQQQPGQPHPAMPPMQNPGMPQQQRPPLVPEATSAQQSSPVFEFLPGVASLVEDLDKRVLVTLRDGRHFVGMMRSFDQYGNVMLEDTYERHVIGNVYADERVGLYVIRGENLVLLGELDQERDRENAKLREVTLKEIQDKKAEMRQERAEDDLLRKKLAQQALGLGFEDCL